MRLLLRLGCVLCVIAVVCGLFVARRDAGAQQRLVAASSDAVAPVSPTTTSTPATTTPTPTTIAPLDTLDQRVAAALGVIAAREGTTSFSLVDLATGERVDEPTSQAPLRSASIIKVAIAVAVLRTRPSPSDDEQALLTAMIEDSDNDAATELFDEAGGSAGLQQVVDDLGMTDTIVSPAWGFTTTTAGDLATLFAAVASGQALDADGTARLLSLMQNVIPSQAFGAKDVVGADVPVALKDGWFPDTDAPVYRVNCGAIVGDPASAMVVTTTASYPQSLGLDYGEDTCRSVAAALLADG